jgi:hypothetical protein
MKVKIPTEYISEQEWRELIDELEIPHSRLRFFESDAGEILAVTIFLKLQLGEESVGAGLKITNEFRCICEKETMRALSSCISRKIQHKIIQEFFSEGSPGYIRPDPDIPPDKKYIVVNAYNPCVKQDNGL